MTEFLKTFGRGVLYVVLLPFILLFVVLYMVYLLIAYIIMAIKSAIIFFTGGDPLGDLPEDIEAKKILASKEASLSESNNQQIQNNTTNNTNNNSTVINQSIYVNPNDLAAFFAQQAAQQNQQQLMNQVQPQPIDVQPDPLFLETTKEGGNDDVQPFTDSINRQW